MPRHLRTRNNLQWLGLLENLQPTFAQTYSIKKRRLNAGPLKQIVLTHGHPDHVRKLHAIGSLKPCFKPGHSPRHVVFYHEKDRIMLCTAVVSTDGSDKPSPL
ncbi:MBL fold metallo-hydrolase [Paenibacillus sinopodophylli]|uniref:MBL fold metallo-hydrolase n=1 Tax=Paenibacillus sinopodophylli TaxID=1837342 RepID=UPI00110C9215